MRDIDFQAGSLPGRAVMTVTGPEAAHFLHNLLTADIDHLAEGAAAYAALLTPQGKILFDMFVLRAGDGFLIDCAAGQRADLLKRLSMYKLRARVELAARDDLAVGVSPVEIAGSFQDPRCPEIGWRIIGAAHGEAQGYDAARIAAGLADSAADLGSGDVFPHEANLDQLGGVSFRKGCYVGQEVVSRMEHRGTARSRILPVAVEGPMPPRGTDIRAGDKQVGTLLSSSGRMALALIRLDRLAEATAPLVADGATVTVEKPAWARYEVPGAA
ncbi:folate-binding protein [Aestuariivirga litoralis]|uniref:Folate-binding protein n=1 Tax=Aestuariivirga litoralis TaxID=2650924 RepID=A0A2W2BQP8_9HYPH|nr:folate-binding protein YgfZ [Aestuariivirga litoralis]PZF75716.1 folate-binding protein [Aestuariivirga litoralis]